MIGKSNAPLSLELTDLISLTKWQESKLCTRQWQCKLLTSQHIYDIIYMLMDSCYYLSLFPTSVGIFFWFIKLFFKNLLTTIRKCDIIYTSKESTMLKRSAEKEENMEKIMYQINNYQLGAKLKSCPLEKILKQERKDSKHTEVWFANLTKNEQQLVNKLLGKPKFISAE